MEELEQPTEHVQDEIHERAHESRERWVSRVALTTAILAAFAAVTGLLSGHHEHEAMMEQIEAFDKWNYYQAKGIKAGILSSKLDQLRAFDKPVSAAEEKKLGEYHKDQERINEQANELKASSELHNTRHVILAGGVTLFQVAIAICAIAVLTKRPSFWHGSMVLGVLGLAFLIWGMTVRPPVHSIKEPSPKSAVEHIPGEKTAGQSPSESMP